MIKLLVKIWHRIIVIFGIAILVELIMSLNPVMLYLGNLIPHNQNATDVETIMAMYILLWFCVFVFISILFGIHKLAEWLFDER